jgi:hypothetical protein
MTKIKLEKKYDFIYSSSEEMYIAIPHKTNEDIKNYYERLFKGTSGRYSCIPIKEKLLNKLNKLANKRRLR